MMMKNEKIHIEDCGDRSECPLTCVLDLVGDKWALIIIRDMLFIGKKQFGDFLDSPEAISTNILTNRLKKLEKCGIIEKRPYQEAPVRYEYFLTDAGKELESVIMSIAQWGAKHIEGVTIPTEEEIAEVRAQYADR